MNPLLHFPACSSRPPPAPVKRLAVSPGATRDAPQPELPLPAEICYGCVDWFPYASEAAVGVPFTPDHQAPHSRAA